MDDTTTTQTQPLMLPLRAWRTNDEAFELIEPFGGVRFLLVGDSADVDQLLHLINHYSELIGRITHLRGALEVAATTLAATNPSMNERAAAYSIAVSALRADNISTEMVGAA